MFFKKLCIAIVFIGLCLKAEDTLIIDAKKFEADEKKGYTLFQGDVKVKKTNDILNADRLEVYMSTNAKGNNEPSKYIATGNVSFKINSKDKVYEGKGNKLIFDTKKESYEIIGNGYIKELNEDKTLYGDNIYIDQNSGEAKIEGTDSKPVRFIMKIGEDK